ncbi:uracil-DNA glycosylase family protein [Sphingomonas morindae]|uniref:Uracil-DNA glycosylase n=1 Tax=Sphingomonas morindae TaxID=1541170 RepID=A0ABY4X4Q8_9SPHN|nr:uracil-DNA glycosylase family protein [Sphingomonas morindae]USI71874.1 uracil-DNA glycosylase [Sphingomonas morindae]
MLNGGEHRFGDLIASALGWWSDAGVDSAILETPRDWLAPPPPATHAAPVAPDPAAPLAIAAPAAAAPLDDLAALQAWLATEAYLPEAPPPRRRVAPSGAAGATLMIVADMPDEADLRAGRLFAEEAALVDAMLTAIGQRRETLYCAPLSPGRLPGGRLGAAAPALVELLRAQIALVRPRALLCFGEEASRALFDRDLLAASQALTPLDHGGHEVAAIATFHPRTLRRQPPLKAEAWRSLQHLLGALVR